MIGTTKEETRIYLEALAARIDGASTFEGESPGFCVWLRIATPPGFVGVWDAEELGEHGLFVQAYEMDDNEDVTFAGELDWISDRACVEDAVAVVRRYLAGPSVRRSPVEQGQLQAEPQQPGLLGGHRCRVGFGQVT